MCMLYVFSLPVDVYPACFTVLETFVNMDKRDWKRINKGSKVEARARSRRGMCVDDFQFYLTRTRERKQKLNSLLRCHTIGIHDHETHAASRRKKHATDWSENIVGLIRAMTRTKTLVKARRGERMRWFLSPLPAHWCLDNAIRKVTKKSKMLVYKN